MALSAYCPVCQRTVYIAEDETPICPVCSTVLLEQVPSENGGETPEEAFPAQ